ncbi:MAG: hypothetical protein JW920_02455 [Deltaproteobacteria bacterium]|nr:hypothetical protein [Deltaproteobacteria bacterium]
MSIFEIIMLACFGAAWPSSIYTSYTSRTSKGKSIIFLGIVFIGYICGVLHKVYFNFDWVVLLYAINGSMVLCDMGLYFRNLSLDRQMTL